MEHKFNIQFARDYGIEEAIILDNIYFWIAKNVANEKHKHDGRYWTYNSAKAFSELFPYMNETKIYRVLANLENLGLIIKGNFNKEKYDRMNWFSFTDAGLSKLKSENYDVTDFSDTLQNNEMQFAKMQNGICKNAKSISIFNTKNTNTDNKTDNKHKNDKDKSLSKKSTKDDLFEQCWLAYKRKGSKKSSKAYWDKLSDDEKQLVLPHIKAYTSSRELQFQKDFERYLRDKIFTTIVFKDNRVIFDPTKNENGTPYIPMCDGAISWNDYYNCYILVGMYYGKVFDGYTDDNRPNGARILLGNGGVFIVWNSETKTWDKEE